MLQQLERLVAAGIRVLPVEGDETHALAERDGCVSLLRRELERFTQVGGAGIVTPHGMAVLIWRNGQPWLQAKGWELEAIPEQVDCLRRFAADLKSALFSD